MKPFALTACVLMLTACGCEPQQEAIDAAAHEAWLVNTVNDTAVRNAIVRQRTLFPYHFAEEGSALNDLGLHDLAVLAAHFKASAGNLSVRRGGAPNELYKARVAAVVGALAKAGVAKDRVRISDALPAGDGMPSERVLVILREPEKEKAEYPRPATVVPIKGAQQ